MNVKTMNKKFSSRPERQQFLEDIDGVICIENALAVHRLHNVLNDVEIMYPDGLGLGEVPLCKIYEIWALTEEWGCLIAEKVKMLAHAVEQGEITLDAGLTEDLVEKNVSWDVLMRFRDCIEAVRAVGNCMESIVFLKGAAQMDADLWTYQIDDVLMMFAYIINTGLDVDGEYTELFTQLEQLSRVIEEMPYADREKVAVLLPEYLRLRNERAKMEETAKPEGGKPEDNLEGSNIEEGKPEGGKPEGDQERENKVSNDELTLADKCVDQDSTSITLDVLCEQLTDLGLTKSDLLVSLDHLNRTKSEKILLERLLTVIGNHEDNIEKWKNPSEAAKVELMKIVQWELEYSDEDVEEAVEGELLDENILSEGVGDVTVI